MFGTLFGSFHLLDNVLWGPKVLNFYKDQFVFFIICAFNFVCKKLLPYPRSWRHIMFPCISFIALVITSKCMVSFEWILHMVHGKGVNLSFCLWLSSCLNTICWQDSPFPRLALVSLLKGSWPWLFISGLSAW